MTNQLLRKQMNELRIQTRDLEARLSNAGSMTSDFAKLYIPLREELCLMELLLASRHRPFQWVIDLLYAFSVSWIFLLSGYSFGLSLLLVGINVLAVFIFFQYSRQLIQLTYQNNLPLWFFSESGGTLPEWYMYRKSIHRHLVGLAILFLAWIFPFLTLLPFSKIAFLSGLILMLTSLFLEYRHGARLELPRIYSAAKGIAELKTIHQRIDAGEVDLNFRRKRG